MTPGASHRRVFGLACFGGESAWVSKLLDKSKWRAMPLVGKVTVVVIGVALAAGAAAVMYRVL